MANRIGGKVFVPKPRNAFNELALICVYARYLARNPASERVMQKLHIQYEGTLRQHTKKWEQYEDYVFYGLLEHEWQPVDFK